MMKQNFFLLCLLLTGIILSCSRDKPEVVLPPEISGLEATYSILEGTPLELEPTITNDNQAAYFWLLGGKAVSSALKYTFTVAEPGTYTLVFKATNKGGTAQKETIITVIAKGLPPVISNLQDEYEVPGETDLLLTPNVVSDNDVTYSWLINDEEVATTKDYTFNTALPGKHLITLKATNKGGITEKTITIFVTAKTIALSTQTHTLLYIETPGYAAGEESAAWSIQNAPDGLYRLSYADTKTPVFISANEGEYTLQMQAGNIKGEVKITVGKRKKTPSPFISKVFDYMPAPGQFVNKLPQYIKGDTHEDMVRKAGEWLVGEDAFMITLGGWGGYVTFGFDHTIVNIAGKRDFRVNGNAFGAALGRPGAPFGGSCEPGIIMVAYDKNKNGKPDDDEWYEIKGSSNFSAEKEPWYQIAKGNGNDVRVFRDYEMTYYKPEKETPEIAGEPDNPLKFVTISNYIRWKDNKGNDGYKVKNVYHTQTYYPAWVTNSSLTYKGIRLPENGVNEGEHVPGINDGNVYFVLYGFRYGYVDNQTNISNESAIDIDWAIDKDGNPANLPGIDFVKVYNGVNQENGWIGECSTEVERGEDLHLLGKNIDTIKKQ